jgi:hypothetical protein
VGAAHLIEGRRASLVIERQNWGFYAKPANALKASSLVIAMMSQ